MLFNCDLTPDGHMAQVGIESGSSEHAYVLAVTRIAGYAQE